MRRNSSSRPTLNDWWCDGAYYTETIIKINPATKDIGTPMILEKGFKNLRSEAMTVFAVMPRSPVDLGEIREIKKERSIWFEFGEPIF